MTITVERENLGARTVKVQDNYPAFRGTIVKEFIIDEVAYKAEVEVEIVNINTRIAVLEARKVRFEKAVTDVNVFIAE